jgi:hypothetical protein
VDVNGPIVQGTIPVDNAAFRAPRFAPDYPAFDGRDLTPMGPIELDPTDVAEGVVPPRFTIGANYPNPFRAATTMTFSLRDAAPVTLNVYDVTGRHVATLLEGPLQVGEHRHTWRASELPSGIYYYTLRVGSETQARKMTLVR